MARAKCEYDWAIASSQMALLANCHRNPKSGKVFVPADFNPYMKNDNHKVVEITKENVSLMREAFIGNKHGRQ